MTWTYTGSDPSASNLNAVRARVGDTDTNNQQLQNEEIAYFITQYGLVSTAVPTTAVNDQLDAAAADACDAIAAKLMAKVSTKSALGLSRSLSDNVRQYRELAKQYRSGSSAHRAEILVGGIDISDMQDLDNDSTTLQPQFRIGMDDYGTAALPNEGWEDED